MAITSGLRQIRGYVTLGGQQFAVETATVHQTAAKRSSTWSAIAPLQSFPGGDAFFSSLSDNTTSVTVSVNGSQMPLVQGECDTVDIDYYCGEVHLSGRDESAKLHEKKSSEKFANQMRTDIVNTVAQRNGFQAQVTLQDMLMAGKKLQIDFAKMTDGVSDAAILHKLAELTGARWWIKGGTLYFTNTTSGNYIVQYRGGANPSGNFLGLHVHLNLQAMKMISVNVNSWHDGKKMVITAQKQANGQINGMLTYNFRSGGLEQDHADNLAKNKLSEITRHQIGCTVEMVGDPSIDVGMGLQLQGTAFDQTLEMDSITHEIGDSFYTMSISARGAQSQGGGNS